MRVRLQNIGRYELRRELGRGTMGVVYEAFDPELGRGVALKTIRIGFALPPRERDLFERRFQAEARIAAKLSHPGIVAVHDVGRDTASGELYIALELLEGRTLADVVRTEVPIPWREAFRIVARISEALHHAHAHGVVHRDIKPGNIMLLASGQPKIMDFGIAKSETARIKLTATGQFFGTPLYMAPEHALGRTVDGRADLFSLGAIGYTLLTGQQAFGADNITKIITRVIQEDPPPPSTVVPGLPEAADYAIARALAKEPPDRYPDGRMLAEDAQDVLDGRPARHREGWTPPPRRAAAPPTLPPLAGAAGGTEVLDLELVLIDTGRPEARARLDIEAELERLVAGRGHAAGDPSGRTQPPPDPTSGPLYRRGREVGPVPRVSRRSWSVPVLTVAALASAALFYSLSGRSSPDLLPSGIGGAGEITAPSARVLPVAPTASPDQAAATPDASVLRVSPAPAVPPARAQEARLEIDLEHPLKHGALRIWLDGALVVDKHLEGRVTRNLAGLKLRKGRLSQVVEVRPGERRVRVQVAWDDNLKEAGLSGVLRAGATRRLEVRLGRLRKNLSLGWADGP